jgi:hypothetical protein
MDNLPESRPQRRTAKRCERTRRVRRQIRLFGGPHLDSGKLSLMVDALARTTVLGIDAFEYLRTHGLVNSQGELRDSVQKYTALIGLQLKLATALGLTAVSMGKIDKTRRVDLAGAIADAEVIDG